MSNYLSIYLTIHLAIKIANSLGTAGFPRFQHISDTFTHPSSYLFG